MILSALRLLSMLLVVAGAIYAVVVATMYLIQPRLMYYPWREITETPADYGAVYEDISLPTSDGELLYGWWVPAESSVALDGLTVLFCHGNAGNLTHRAAVVAAMAAEGLNVLVFDYRGYGRSSGKPTEQGTYRDAEAALRWLHEASEVPDDRIMLFGRSLGGAVAAWLATRMNPRALVLESTFTSVPDVARVKYPWLPPSISRYHYPTEEYVTVMDCPVFIIHGRDDEIVPYDLGRRLYYSAFPPKRFYDKSGGHNDGFLQPDRPGFEDRMRLFVRFAEYPLSVVSESDGFAGD